VLRLIRNNDDALPTVQGPQLASDLSEHDGLASVIEALSSPPPSLILGQGTGPYANDAAELAALSAFIDKAIPIATPLSHFGHTLGASSLLSIALAATRPSLPNAVANTTDGRPIRWPPVREILVTCRALNGACAATSVGGISNAKT